MTKKQRWLVSASAAFSLCFGIMPAAFAMHIMEGYLPVGYCVLWGVVSLPFLIWGFISIKKTVEENRRSITLLAMAGAFIFVISSLKIPSVTGSCSHMTGTGLGALLFGPAAVSVLGIIVLIFQAILLAHGGLTTLGANTFSMAIAGPFVSYGIYLLCNRMKVNRKVTVFLACAVGDLFTYLCDGGGTGLWPIRRKTAAWPLRSSNSWASSRRPSCLWPSSKGFCRWSSSSPLKITPARK